MRLDEPELLVDFPADLGKEVGGAGVSRFVGLIDGRADFAAVIGERMGHGFHPFLLILRGRELR